MGSLDFQDLKLRASVGDWVAQCFAWLGDTRWSDKPFTWVPGVVTVWVLVSPDQGSQSLALTVGPAEDAAVAWISSPVLVVERSGG